VFEKTRQSRVSPASPYIPPPRRSGRSPALPYPPGGQNEYSRFFHSTQPAFPGRAMPEKTTLFLADETRSEHFCAVQGELGLTCPIEGWAKRQRSPPSLIEAVFHVASGPFRVLLRQRTRLRVKDCIFEAGTCKSADENSALVRK